MSQEENVEVKPTGWHFTRVPNAPLFNPDLSSVQKAVFVALCSFMDSGGEGGYPSYRKIAERASCSKRAAIAAIEKLVEHGYVLKEYRYNEEGDQTSNIYRVVTDAPRGESGARGVVHEMHPGSESGAPKREPSNESQLNERGKRHKARHEETGLLMCMTTYNKYVEKYGTHTFNRYAEKIKAWHDSKGKKYPSDVAAAVLRWTYKDEDEGKSPEKRKPREVCASCGRPRVGTEGSCMYCLDGQFVEAS